jgi:hypothetical protein
MNESALEQFYADIKWDGWYGDEPHIELRGKTISIDGSQLTLEYLKKVVTAWEKYNEATKEDE